MPGAPAPDTGSEAVTKALQKPVDAVPLLRKVIAQMADDDGWVGLGGVGQRLPHLAPDFDPRTYGFTKLRDLVRETGAFEVEEFEDGYVRIRPNPSAGRRRRNRRTEG